MLARGMRGIHMSASRTSALAHLFNKDLLIDTSHTNLEIPTGGCLGQKFENGGITSGPDLKPLEAGKGIGDGRENGSLLRTLPATLLGLLREGGWCGHPHRQEPRERRGLS